MARGSRTGECKAWNESNLWKHITFEYFGTRIYYNDITLKKMVLIGASQKRRIPKPTGSTVRSLPKGQIWRNILRQTGRSGSAIGMTICRLLNSKGFLQRWESSRMCTGKIWKGIGSHTWTLGGWSRHETKFAVNFAWLLIVSDSSFLGFQQESAHMKALITC